MNLIQSRRLLLALGLGVLAACSDSGGDKTAAAGDTPASSASTLEAAKSAGKIRIGYANEAPFAYMDSKEAKVTGEAIASVAV